MTLYHVHIYREMRLYFPGIKAGTPEEAAKIAADRLTQEAELIDDCDGESTARLVDVASDDDYEHSRVIDFSPNGCARLPRNCRTPKDLLGDLPSVQGGVCQHCGREYHDIPTGDCPSDDCPSFKALAAIATATAVDGGGTLHLQRLPDSGG